MAFAIFSEDAVASRPRNATICSSIASQGSSFESPWGLAASLGPDFWSESRFIIAVNLQYVIRMSNENRA
jgi:hypothetical protein